MNDSLDIDIDTDGSFWYDKISKDITHYTESQLNAFAKYFKELKPGVLIPPCAFQSWLHPELKLNYTEQAEGYPDGWIRMK